MSITKEDIKFINDNEGVIRYLLKIKEAQHKAKFDKTQTVKIPVNGQVRTIVANAAKNEREMKENKLKNIVDKLTIKDLDQYIDEDEDNEEDEDDDDDYRQYNAYINSDSDDDYW